MSRFWKVVGFERVVFRVILEFGFFRFFVLDYIGIGCAFFILFLVSFRRREFVFLFYG